MFNIVSIKKRLYPETAIWAAGVLAAGGGFETNSLLIANGFMRQLKLRSYAPKIVYLLPLLGTGIGAARMPLVDTLNVGAATNTNFVNADFSQGAGLQGNGSNKLFSTLVFASQLGSSSNGGLGWYENNVSFAGDVQPMGSYNNAADNRYVLDLRSNRESFRWGNAGNDANSGATAVNAHYYGQRSSATSRVIYKNGSSLASNTTNDGTSGSNERAILLFSGNEPGASTTWAGRCAATYLTDGTLTDPEIADLDLLIRAYLLGPTGKPQS